MYTLVSALAEEIQFLKRTRIHSTYTLFDGYLVSTSSDFKNDEELICSGYYRFENKQLLTLASNTGALFTINGTKYKGFIEYCDRFAIEVSIDDFHAYTIDSVSVEIESWRLLEIQSNRLSEIKEDKIVRALQSEHYHPAKEVSDYIYGQEQSIKHAKENEISVIWGPPGTGKTYTLAKIALNEARAGKRVLILSQSNMAVDSAILQLKKAVGRNNQENYKTHLFLRYGMARSPELLEYPEFLSWDVAINSNIKNRNEYESLLELSKSKNLSDEKLNEIKTKRAELISRIAKEELEIINNTKIVAMTATKATINKDISRQNWDTVIFDEISMAYISQVMIAGSLAKKKLVLIGDFKQLAPIVQNDNPNSLLRKDIFSYLNIVSNGTVRKHKWLVMLNTQWRMHTEIAEFANKYIYDGKLRTAGDSVYDTALIASKGPFNNKVFTYVDYSAYQGTCYSTQYGSRFNLLSASLSVKLALKAIKEGQTSIGILTPYAAQSQIINALLQDIEEQTHKKLSIFCSTIHQFQGSERDVIIFDTVENLPKKEAGRIISSSDDDSSMRLINVALTRTRGKFIIIGCHEYLRLHQNDISDEMWNLILTSKKCNYLLGEDVWSLLQENIFGDCIKVYDSIQSAVPVFKSNLAKCNEKNENYLIEYWHAPRNSFLPNKGYSFGEFLSFSLSISCYKRIYTTDAGVAAIQNQYTLPKSKIRDCSISPKDDVVIIDDIVSERKTKIVWINIIPVKSNNEYGERIIYSFVGNTLANQYRKLTGFDLGLRIAKEKEKLSKIDKGDFSEYIKSKIGCNEIGCAHLRGIKLAKAQSGKYYIKCFDCGNVVSPFIPFSLIEDYIEDNNLKCGTCGCDIRISRKGYLYCSDEYTHDIGFNLNDIIEGRVASNKKATREIKTSRENNVHVIKKSIKNKL